MKVYDLIDLLTDAATIEIFSFEQGESVFLGCCDEIPNDIGESIVTSIDGVFPESQHLTINIECIE